MVGIRCGKGWDWKGGDKKGGVLRGQVRDNEAAKREAGCSFVLYKSNLRLKLKKEMRKSPREKM
jgi:hypothetical protein